MEIDAKTLTKAAAVAGALATIAGVTWGGLSWASPYLATKPPFAEARTVEQLAQVQQQHQQSMQQMQQHQLFLTQQFWVNQQTEAQIALRRNPRDVLAAKQLNAATAALASIQRQLFGR